MQTVRYFESNKYIRAVIDTDEKERRAEDIPSGYAFWPAWGEIEPNVVTWGNIKEETRELTKEECRTKYAGTPFISRLDNLEEEATRNNRRGRTNHATATGTTARPTDA